MRSGADGAGGGVREEILAALDRVYSKKIRPIEEAFSFDRFYSPCLSTAEIRSKPIVLLLGQYSTGKTSLIEFLLGQSYPGAHIGPEPTTDKFVAVMHGSGDRIVPGNAAASQHEKPFRGLEKFGNAFLSKFQVAETDSKLLERVTFIDTPGVLSGEKQRLGRAYDFVNVCAWFAERSDMILLMFDAHKLDISDEFKRTINVLKDHDEKVRVLLNKATMIGMQQLMRVYGALMWSLGKVLRTPEVVRVYIGSFIDGEAASSTSEASDFLQSEKADLVGDVFSLPKNALVRKINTVVRRARLSRVHAYLLCFLRSEMPVLFGKATKQASLLNNLPSIFAKVERLYNLPPGDFPEIERFRSTLQTYNISDFPRYSNRLFLSTEEALAKDLPSLLQSVPLPSKPFRSQVKNPFLALAESNSALSESDVWAWSNVQRSEFSRLFDQIYEEAESRNNRIKGSDLYEFFLESNLSKEDLSAIWKLSDQSNDGSLDRAQFIIAMHLTKCRLAGHELPSKLPDTLLPVALDLNKADSIYV